MTAAELGKQLKRVHPAYADIPDAKLGAALQAKYPGYYRTDDAGGLDDDTVPEKPRTLAIQLEQLQQGLRRVVFIAKGSKTKINAADYGMRRLTLPSGDYIYDQQAIKPQEIIAAVKNHELNEILGTVENGYGAPPKEDIQGEPIAVVSRDTDGETAHSALTDEQHIPETAEAAQTLTPPGGNLSIEPPHVEIEHRLQDYRPRGKRWPKPNVPVKVPVGAFP